MQSGLARPCPRSLSLQRQSALGKLISESRWTSRQCKRSSARASCIRARVDTARECKTSRFRDARTHLQPATEILDRTSATWTGESTISEQPQKVGGTPKDSPALGLRRPPRQADFRLFRACEGCGANGDWWTSRRCDPSCATSSWTSSMSPSTNVRELEKEASASGSPSSHAPAIQAKGSATCGLRQTDGHSVAPLTRPLSAARGCC